MKSAVETTKYIDTELDIYNILYDKIMSNLNAFTLGKFESVDTAYSQSKKYGIVNVRIVPAIYDDIDVAIKVYCFSKLIMSKLKSGDFVGIIYADKKFIDNINTINTIKKTSSSSEYHAISNGILVDISQVVNGDKDYFSYDAENKELTINLD